METTLQFRLFGTVEIYHGDQLVTEFRTSKAQALLCYLVVTGQTHTRATLAGLLWGELPESNARMNLSKTLTNLRRLVGTHLEITRQTIGFNQEAPYQLDMETFSHHLSQDSTIPTIEQLQEAVDLYRGDFLEGFYVRQAPAFEEWVLTQRVRLRELALHALHTLVTHFTEQGEAASYATGIDYVTRLLALEPWREEAHRQLMRLLALTGQRSAALAQFAKCRQLLAEELDVEPGPETMRLYDRIRAGELRQPDSQSGTAKGAELKPDDRTSPPGGFGQSSPTPLSLPSFLTSSLVQSGTPPTVVGRERELAQLDQFLEQSLNTQGRVVFISGAAGQGKTVLAENFVRAAQQKQADLIVVSGQCNAYGGIGDPYLPFREVLGMLTGDIEAKWAAGIIDQEQARRLWDILPHMVQTLVKIGPDLVDVFVSGPALEARATSVVTPGSDWLNQLSKLVERKAMEQTPATLTQNALFMQYTKLLQTLARQKPLLLLLDDLQWADTGSISLLFHLGQRLTGYRILVVGIYRPGELAPGSPIIDAGEQDRHPLATVINEFQRSFGAIHIDLDQAADRRFVDALTDVETNRLSESFRQALLRQTAGHALFTVEMLHGLQERGDLVKDEQGRWIEGPNLNWKILPDRVEGVIKERINRLPATSQKILRIASVEGETFTAEVAAHVQGDESARVVQRFAELSRIQRLVQDQGSQRLAESGQHLSFYRFRHILFQSYLYNSLDKNEQEYLHEAVGQALEALYGEQSEQIAVRLAHHFREAEVPDKAIHYLQRAGQQAIRSYANHEAIMFFNEALTLLKALPETPERIQQELDLQLAVIPPLIATKGYAATEVGKASARAQALGQSDDTSFEGFYAMRALWSFRFVRAELRQARELSQQLLSMAQDLPSPAVVDAYHALGGTFCTLGDFARSRKHFEQAIARYKPRQHQTEILFFGPDLGVFCYAWNAHPLSHLGFLDQARQSSQEALRLAETMDHPFSLAVALTYGAMMQQFCQDIAATKELAERAIVVCNEHGFAYYLAWAKILQGWVRARQNRGREAITQISEGLKEILATDARIREPYYLALLAEAYGQFGQIEQGLSVLDEALTKATEREERWYEAEIHRLRGELLRQQKADEDDIEACFQRAVDVAQQQQNRLQELRAMMSLSQLRQLQNQPETAHYLLAQTYEKFSEGFDTPVLQQASVLLAELDSEAAAII